MYLKKSFSHLVFAKDFKVQCFVNGTWGFSCLSWYQYDDGLTVLSVDYCNTFYKSSIFALLAHFYNILSDN